MFALASAHPYTVSASELNLIVCVGSSNYVLLNAMAWLYFWVLLLCCPGYYWLCVVGALWGYCSVLFAISECKCGVYFHGCHGNHCICGGSDWCCRPSKTVLFLSRVNTWYARARSPTFAHARTHAWIQIQTHSLTQTNAVTLQFGFTKAPKGKRKVYLSSAAQDILIHLHHDN